ncbi:hypothetical protein Nm8I071_35510 [Nonomuraea sp. TT08I-71]|nr:hypothetical protein Nm8I071_35510 [Nonomuraea sp. TT08I-71]
MSTPHVPSPSAPGRPTIDRRRLLAGLGAAGLGAVGAGLLGPPGRARAADALPTVAPLPPGAPDRRAFAPLEQRMAGLLLDVAGMANGVSTDPATYGWMRLPPGSPALPFSWGGRSPDVPYNARIQENVLTMAWFQANARSWNPYAGDAALLARLDAALGYYLGLQHPEGYWSEYSPTERSRAATAFGMSALAGTARSLAAAAALPDTRRRILAALDAAARWFLNPANTDVYSTPVQQYANQAAAGIIGAAEARQAGAAEGLDGQIRERIGYLRDKAQSPAGYFYEPLGQDLGYNFEVMLPDVAKLHARTGDPALVAMADDFAGWLRWNMIREPDGSGYLTNVASSARTYLTFLDDVTDDGYKAGTNSLLVPAVPRLAAFVPTREDKAVLRDAWAANPAPVPAVSVYYAVPTTARDLEYGESFPTAAQKAEAVADLPYLSHVPTVEWRRDPLGAPLGREWVYALRPGAYVGAHFGSRASDIVRTGPAFLWHPRAGMLVHSLNGTTDSCWATVLADGVPDVKNDLAVEYFRGLPADGVRVADPRQVTGAAPLGMRWRAFGDALVKEFTVGAYQVRWSSRAAGAATEQVPLVLHPDDVLTFDDGTTAGYGATTSTRATALELRRGATTIRLSWSQPVTATLAARAQLYFRAKNRRLHALLLPHGGTIDVRIQDVTAD